MTSLDLDCLPLDWFLVVNKRHVDVAQFVCPLGPVHDMWRLTDPDSCGKHPSQVMSRVQGHSLMMVLDENQNLSQ